MKLVFASQCSGLQGGAQGCLLDLVKGLRRIHPDVLIYLIFPNNGELIDAFRPYIDGYALIKQPWWMVEPPKKTFLKTLSRFFRIRRYAHKTLDYLKLINPDVVLTNTIASPVTALACRRGGYKHIWFIHEVPSSSGTYSFLYPEKTILKWVDNLSSQVLVVSDYLLGYYRPFIKNDDKIHKIHVEVTVNSYQRKRTANSCYTLLQVGYFDENKGQEEVINACKLLLTDSFCSFKLLLVGAGNTDYSSYIRRRVVEEGMSQFVTIVDFTTEISSYYNKADVVLICSKSETLSKVNIEAQKCGIPVIATAIDAHKELIQDGYNGVLYQRGDVKSLADAIRRLSDSALRKELGENAISFMLGKYTDSQYVEEFLHVMNR